MGREMLNPVPVMTFLNKDRYAALVLFTEVYTEWVFVFFREVIRCCCYHTAEFFSLRLLSQLWLSSTVHLVK